VSVDGEAAFQEKANVSRETLARFRQYHEILLKWNQKINLISAGQTPEAIWTRHFLDSVQLFDLAANKPQDWVDIGAGGGFPGLVNAILAAEKAPDMRFALVEADARKAAFLQTVNVKLKLSVEVINERVENLEPLRADILSARALAPLPRLLPYAERHLRPDGMALFMKGARYRQEVEEALENWKFRLQEYPSITNGEAVILKLGEIRRV